MRLIIRLLTPSSTLQHLAQKTINLTLSSRSQVNPFQQSQNPQFELSYLITHNTKVIRATFNPVEFNTQQLIKFISKTINISEEYLILKIHNKYYDYQLYKEYNRHTEIENKKVNNSHQNQDKKNQLLKQNQNEKQLLKAKNYGGLQFTQHSIKHCRLLNGFSLSTYNIDLEKNLGQRQPRDIISSSSQTNFQPQQNSFQFIRTLQIQAQIISKYFSSLQYKQIVHQNKQQNVRKTKIFKQKFNLESTQIINQQDQQEQQQNQQYNLQYTNNIMKKKSKKVQNLNFQSYQQQLQQYSSESQKTYDTTISRYYGQLIRIRKPPLKDHVHYYMLDPYQGYFKQFQSKQKYPNFPLQVIALTLITQPFKDIQKISKKDISWYMKKQLFYLSVQFTIKGKKQRFKLATKYQQTLQKWYNSFRSCIQKYQIISKNQKVLKNLVRNDKNIIDKIQLSPLLLNKKKSNQQYKNAFQNVLNSKNNNNESQIEKEVQKEKSKSKNNQEKNNLNQNQDKDLPLPKDEQLCGFNGQIGQNILNKKIKQTKNEQFSSLSLLLKSTQNNNPKNSESKTTSTTNSFNEQQSIKESQKTITLKLNDFKFLKQLGEGSFGQVFLACHIKTTNLYALKAFKKKKLIMNKQIKFAISQINILKQIDHPYIITLYFTFQTPNYIYLGIDYCGGKDLSHHLIQQINFAENECQIYAAELVLALQYLHSKDIIYRDLKPENILLDNDGHLRIIDFGLSKQTQDNFAKSFCGSPAYISPEMLKKNGVGKECDLFSLGAVIYQMIVGEPPFYSEDIKQLYDNIANAKLKFPKVVSQKARSLLQGLLRKNPKSRLGCKGFQQIKSHQFFKGINWPQILKKQHNAPKRATLQLQQQCQQNQQYQQQTELVKILHQDFDYTQATIRINRFKNFSFVREGEF